MNRRLNVTRSSSTDPGDRPETDIPLLCAADPFRGSLGIGIGMVGIEDSVDMVENGDSNVSSSDLLDPSAPNTASPSPLFNSSDLRLPLKLVLKPNPSLAPALFGA